MKKIIIILFFCFVSTTIVGCNSSKINQYTITFDSIFGTKVSPITQDYNTQVTKPTDPTRSGYTFDGWYSDSDLKTVYEFTTMQNKDITLYAKWIPGFFINPLGNNTCSVTRYNGSDHNVVVPSVYNGCLVTEINRNAFYGKDLTSITIPKSVTTIRQNAFYGKTSLKTVIFEEGSQLTTIGDYAFYGTSLTSIAIPNSVKTIGDHAFDGLTSLTTVTFKEESQLTTIGYAAFRETGLTSITIPKSVTTIGDYAFSVASLTSIIIPKSVITIGDFAFYWVTSLTTVTFEEGSQLTTIGDWAFVGLSLTSIIIPKSVTTIGDYAFSVASLSTVIFEEGSQITTIGSGAFSTSLTSIIITATTPPPFNDPIIFQSNLKIYVPSDYVDDYKEAWSDYSSIIYPISES